MARLGRSQPFKPKFQDKLFTAPVVVTNAATGIGTTSATGNGQVNLDGNSVITERGFCWATTANPTTSNSKVIVAGTTGVYSGAMTGLTSNTLYHYRAYAINTLGTSYGADTTFTTLSVAATTYAPSMMMMGMGM